MKPDSLLKPDATVYGVIMNDQITLDRLGNAANEPPHKAPPKAPVLYVKPKNTWSANNATVILPDEADSLEIGAVIGLRMGRDAGRLTPENALQAVDACYLAADLSVPHDSYYRPAIRQKAFDGSLPLIKVENCDLSKLEQIAITTKVNGAVKDNRKFDNLLRKPAQLLADVTEFMTLYAGDVLLLGVVFQSPQAAAGDQITLEIANKAKLQFSLAKEAQV